MDKEQLSGAIEALIFVSGDPVPVKRLEEVLEATEDDLKEAIEALSERYVEMGSGIQIMEVAGGYQLRTRPFFSNQVNKFLERKRKTTLSGPALETLAIIAYKQPITRAEIEVIRGVVVDGVIKSLLDKRLIKVAGIKEVPGRPRLYRTTKRFLEYFGIVSLNDLPPIEEIEKTFAGSSGTSGEEPIVEEENGEKTSEKSIVKTDVQETDVQETDIPETDIPETDIPETDVPETDVPETDVPETDVPETDVPETDVPETDVQETDVQETDVQETENTQSDSQVPENQEETEEISSDDNESDKVSKESTSPE